MAIVKKPADNAGQVALLPQTLNFKVYKGDSLDLEFVVRDARRQSVALEGFRGSFRITDASGATLSPAPEVTTRSDGNLRVYLANTSVFALGTYTYSLQLTDADGTTKTILAGSIVVSQDVA